MCPLSARLCSAEASGPAGVCWGSRACASCPEAAGQASPERDRRRGGWSPNRVGATRFKSRPVLVWPACGAGATGGRGACGRAPAAGPPGVPLAATLCPLALGRKELPGPRGWRVLGHPGSESQPLRPPGWRLLHPQANEDDLLWVWGKGGLPSRKGRGPCCPPRPAATAL